MGQRLLAKTNRIGVLKQPTWGTKLATNTNYQTILNNAKVSIPDPAVNMSTFDYTSSDGLLVEANRIYTDSVTGLKKLNFAGFAYKEQLAIELAAIFQSIVEYKIYADAESTSGDATITVGSVVGLGVGQTISMTGVTFGSTHHSATAVIASIGTGTIEVATGYEPEQSTIADVTVTDVPKEFTLNNTLIDYATVGILASIAHQNGSTVTDGVKLNDAVLDTYTLSINNDGQGIERLLKREGTWVGRTMETEQDFTGTWTTTASPTYYKDFILNLVLGSDTFNGVCWKNFSLKIDRNITPECAVNGIAGNYLSTLAVEATIDIPYTDATYTVFGSYIAGDNVQFQLYSYATGILNAYVNGGISIAGVSGKLKSNPFQYDGEYQALRLVIEISKQPTVLLPMIVIADGIEWSLT